MIRNERLRIPEEGYKRGGKVKGKKKAKRKVTAKHKPRGKRVTLPPLTTGSMGIGQGSYQATVAPPSGGAVFQAPSYFRAVGSSDNYAVVPPVLKEFIKQQEKMWEDLKRGKATVDGTPMADVAGATPVAGTTAKPKAKVSKADLMAILKERRAKKKEEEESKEAVVGGGESPYAFAPASGDVMKPVDAVIDAPSSSFAPLHASPPDDLSQSASASSAVASSASSSGRVSPQVSESEEEEDGEEVGAGGAPLLPAQPVVESLAVRTARRYEDTSKIDLLSGDTLTGLATSLGIQTSKKEGGVKKRLYSSEELRKILKERVLSLLTGGSQEKVGRPVVKRVFPSSSSSSSSSSGAF